MAERRKATKRTKDPWPPGHYAKVPVALLDDDQIGDGDFRTFVLLCRLREWGTNAATVGAPTLARRCGCDERTAQRRIDRLEKLGWIERVPRGKGKANRYILKDEPARATYGAHAVGEAGETSDQPTAPPTAAPTACLTQTYGMDAPHSETLREYEMHEIRGDSVPRPPAKSQTIPPTDAVAMAILSQDIQEQLKALNDELLPEHHVDAEGIVAAVAAKGAPSNDGARPTADECADALPWATRKLRRKAERNRVNVEALIAGRIVGRRGDAQDAKTGNLKKG